MKKYLIALALLVVLIATPALAAQNNVAVLKSLIQQCQQLLQVLQQMLEQEQAKTAITINAVSGPTSLNVGQEGIWSVSSTATGGTGVTYSFDWGDNSARTVESYVKTPIFGHTYSKAGTYVIKLVVSGYFPPNPPCAYCGLGIVKAEKSITVVVGGNTSVTKVTDKDNLYQVTYPSDLKSSLSNLGISLSGSNPVAIRANFDDSYFQHWVNGKNARYLLEELYRACVDPTHAVIPPGVGVGADKINLKTVVITGRTFCQASFSDSGMGQTGTSYEYITSLQTSTGKTSYVGIGFGLFGSALDTRENFTNAVVLMEKQVISTFGLVGFTQI